nr:MAG TPA: hypothetical protein [Caudoviricetes sp.]
MDKIIEFLPKDLPTWAVIVVTITLVAGFILIAKLTSNSNKQNIGSNNKISGSINQRIGNNNKK